MAFCPAGRGILCKGISWLHAQCFGVEQEFRVNIRKHQHHRTRDILKMQLVRETEAFFPPKTCTNISIFKQYTSLSTKLHLQHPQTAFFFFFFLQDLLLKDTAFPRREGRSAQGPRLWGAGRSLAAARALGFPWLPLVCTARNVI